MNRPRIHSDPQIEIRPEGRGLAIRGARGAASAAAARRQRMNMSRAERASARVGANHRVWSGDLED